MKIKRIISILIVGAMLISGFTALAGENAIKIELNKFEYAPNEKMHIKISGLTEEQIVGGAMIQIAEARHADIRSGTYIKAADLEDGVWEPIAPFEVRAFEVRIYTKDDYIPENFLARELFVIRGNVTLEVVNGTNGISDWAVDEVQAAIFDKLTTEKVVADFQKDITREEFCEMVVNMYESATKTVAQAAADTTFTDTKNEAILKANALGIVEGVGDNKFDPDAPITRQEIATMFFRAVKKIAPEANYSTTKIIAFADMSAVADWALDAVNYFAFKEIIRGDGTNFLPLDNCTCQEGIVLVKRIYDAYK